MGKAREDLHAVVERAVRQAVNDHGPIESCRASSAAKRIAGALVDTQWSDLAAEAAVERLHKRIQEMKHGNSRTLDHNARLRAEVESLRTQLAAARKQFQAIRDTKTWAYSAANTGHDFPARCSFALSDMDGIAKHALCGATDCGCAEEFCCDNTPKNRLVDHLAAVRTDLSEARAEIERLRGGLDE